ncbi:vacuolar membrane protein-domain-containing protein [Mycena haematopus]|nr:vacuolar membrane protein-domain-containing protein [Mycena haematopus]
MDNVPSASNNSSTASTSNFSFAGDDVDLHSCRLLGPIALTVQALMGVLVILSLVYKRHREKPMRPWRIWLFDVSKQVFGQMFVHVFNVLISSLVSHHSANNACVSYFLNILIDTTLGVGLIYVVLRVLTFIVSERFQLKGFESGVYGNPPSVKYWMRQAAIYILALTAMKFMVIGLLALLPGLWTLAAWLLSWTWSGQGDTLEVIFVMGIFPIIMNIVQFWLIDSIVKASGVALDPDAPDPLDREPLFHDPDDEDEDEGVNVHAQTDIESHPRPVSRSLSPSSGRSVSSDKLRTPLEPKISGSSTPGKPVDMHAYPPSIASSASSSSPPPPQAPVLREARKLKPKRRNAPSPITIRNNNRPAVNSPRPGPTPKSAPAPPAPEPAPAPIPPPTEPDVWGESWEDTDDWADKVGEEDWTGRRLEEKKSVLSEWDANGSPMVNSVHAIAT